MEDGRIARDMVDQTLREHAGLGLADRPLAEHVHQPVAFLLDYNDGLRAALLQLNNYYGQRWFYAARVNGRVVIYDELCLGEIRQASRERYGEIMRHLVRQGAEGIILGCTEIGLLVGAEDSPVRIFDTTRIHAEAAVDYALEK
jgi:hypothetical protein